MLKNKIAFIFTETNPVMNFDTLETPQYLKDKGFTDSKSEVIVNSMEAVQHNDPVTESF